MVERDLSLGELRERGSDIQSNSWTQSLWRHSREDLHCSPPLKTDVATRSAHKSFQLSSYMIGRRKGDGFGTYFAAIPSVEPVAQMGYSMTCHS